jgi:hypothetical protein
MRISNKSNMKMHDVQIMKLYECICLCIYDDYADKTIVEDTKVSQKFESSIQSSVNPQKRETNAGENRDQHPIGSTLAGEGGDLLRKGDVIESAGNFKSTPY